MFDYKKTLAALTALPSIAGNELRCAQRAAEIISPYFDEHSIDAMGNQLYIKRRGGGGDAPRLFIDAHYDTVGLIVYDICDDGSLAVAKCGGVDRKILPAAELCLYPSTAGCLPIYGIVSSTPPHLMSQKDRERVPDINMMRVDTGYTKKQLCDELGVRIGSQLGFMPHFDELLNDRVAGCSFDDKACVAAALWAFDMIENEHKGDLRFDIYLSVSAVEETGVSGAARAAFAVKPDLALALDVGFAASPDSPEKNGTSPLGSGVIVSVSAVTSVKLTRRLLHIADDGEIKYTLSAEPSSTGTNGDDIGMTAAGIPTAVLGIPLRSMHTYGELLDCADARELARLTAAAACNHDLEVWCRD